MLDKRTPKDVCEEAIPSFDSNIPFVYFRAKGARARVDFPAAYFLYFITRIARTPSLFL